jgi:4-hydroxybenzoate polyprenyltransferase
MRERLSMTIPTSQITPASIRAVIRLLRPSHWVKNLFVLAALVFSRSYHDPARVGAALWAAVVFSLAASAVYVFNDLRDAAGDRRHVSKRLRPIASGEVSESAARRILLVLLAATALALVPLPAIARHVAAYVLLNIAYSLWLKRVPWLDLLTLTAGFSLRVDAGAAAVDVPLSSWMLSASLALAFFMATLKRYSELASHGDDARPVLSVYSAKHLRWAAWAGGAAAIGSYTLFVLFVRPFLVPTLAPVILGTVRYYWLVVHREGGDSPLTLILRDPWLMVTIVVWALSCLMGLA